MPKPSPLRKRTTARGERSLTPEQIAERLHSTTCQSLTGARFLLSVIGQQLPPEAKNAQKLLKKVDVVLSDSCTELRDLMKELRVMAGKGALTSKDKDLQ